MDENNYHLQNVRNKYTSLHSLIGSLAAKVSGVSSNIEGEFLQAYRVHMVEIQTELLDLRQLVSNAEEEIKQDESVAKLRSEVTWYSNEATRLQTHAESMKRDMQHMLLRVNALREQQSFLSEQLKSVMKRSRILESEIESFYDREDAVRESIRLSESKSLSKQIALAKANSIVELFKDKNKISSKKINKLSNSDKMRQKMLSYSASAPIIQSSPWDNGSSCNNINEHHKYKVVRTDTEIALETAVKSVWYNVAKRKVDTAVSVGLAKSDTADVKQLYKDITPKGITGLGLEYFTEIDRLAVIMSFLNDTKQFENVVKVLSNYQNNISSNE